MSWKPAVLVSLSWKLQCPAKYNRNNYFNIVHSMLCDMLLLININNLHIQSIYKNYTLFPPTCFSGWVPSSGSNTYNMYDLNLKKPVYIYSQISVHECLGSWTIRFTNKFSEHKASWMTYSVSSYKHASHQHRGAISSVYQCRQYL